MELSHDARMGAPRSVFRVAGEVLVRCENGPFEVESALFPTPVGARATTTVGEARARLARSGLTPAIAKQALAAVELETLSSYARGDDVRAVLAKLSPTEAFAGHDYDAGGMVYHGTWLDLRSLAADLCVQHAGFVLQGLHLVSLLDELAPTTTMELENGSDGRLARVAFLKPNTVIGALRKLAPRTRRARGNGLSRAELARWLRDREAVAKPASAARIYALEEALAELDKPESGKLSDIEAWTIEKQLADEDVRGARERIAAYAAIKGDDTTAARYLRAHLALLDGSEPARRIAETLLERASRRPALLRARAPQGARVARRRRAHVRAPLRQDDRRRSEGARQRVARRPRGPRGGRGARLQERHAAIGAPGERGAAELGARADGAERTGAAHADAAAADSSSRIATTRASRRRAS